jgi:hypothetical protein
MRAARRSAIVPGEWANVYKVCRTHAAVRAQESGCCTLTARTRIPFHAEVTLSMVSELIKVLHGSVLHVEGFHSPSLSLGHFLPLHKTIRQHSSRKRDIGILLAGARAYPCFCLAPGDRPGWKA